MRHPQIQPRSVPLVLQQNFLKSSKGQLVTDSCQQWRSLNRHDLAIVRDSSSGLDVLMVKLMAGSAAELLNQKAALNTG